MEEIKVIIAKDGKVAIDVNGVKGKSCKDLTKNLEKALGTTSKDTNKSEFYEENSVNDNQWTGGGY